MSRPFSIWYGDGSRVDGETIDDWRDAPTDGVQVVVEWREPSREAREIRWAGVTDRVLWTGQDTYDPFHFGVKLGQLIDTETYFAIFDEAAHGDR